MAESAGDDQDFIRLWPTTLLRRHLPGHAAANQELTRLIMALDRQHQDLTTDYRADNLLTLDNPAVAWLRQCVNRTVIAYLKNAGIDYEVRWHLHGWANVNRFGDYHDPHNHPRAYLSGTYYVAVPQAEAPRANRRDVRPGSITFYDPRYQANMTAIRGDPNLEAEFTILPQPGLILLWPAFLNHFVHPNLAREPRVSISFNVMLKWSDAYLPQQG